MGNDYTFVKLALDRHKHLDLEQPDRNGTTLLMMCAQAGQQNFSPFFKVWLCRLKYVFKIFSEICVSIIYKIEVDFDNHILFASGNHSLTIIFYF